MRRLVGAQVHFGLRPALGCFGEPHTQRSAPDALAVPEEAPVGHDGKRNVLGPREIGLTRGLWQVELDGVREQWRRDDEDDEQDQHHVDQRDHIDLCHRRGVGRLPETAEGHAQAPLVAGLSGITAPGLAIEEPVVSTAKRSCAYESSLGSTRRFERTKPLYASTAGIATARPSAVMISASPTGPATLSSVPWPETPMLTSAWYTAQTVPKSPTKGAVEPMEASTVRPDSSRAGSSSITRRMARVTNSSLPLRRAATACHARCAKGSSGWTSSSFDSTALIEARSRTPRGTRHCAAARSRW